MRDLALMWMETHYAPFASLLTTVRSGECAASKHYGQPFFPWLSAQPEQIGGFSRAMANLTDGIKAGAIASYDFSDAGMIVDVGVGVVVVEPAARVLALERRLLSGAWQLPQGGIDEDESLDDAMWRELREETGLGPDELTHAADIPLWLGYELPESTRSAKTGRGQVHRWCVLRSRTDGLPIDLGDGIDAEFSAFAWTTFTELTDRCVDFRRPVYSYLAGCVPQLLR